MNNNEGKYTTIHYQSYLELDKILGAQHPRSAKLQENEAHEETLFIIVHQVYELWFKQIIHELQSIMKIFRSEQVLNTHLSTVIGRLQRVNDILELMVKQIGIMETMTPLDFLDFRNYLFPASGFQSFQFRLTEALLGLPEKQRMTYHGKQYDSVFPKKQQDQLDEIYSSGTMLDAVNAWLERMPFLESDDFNFLENYRKSVEAMVDREKEAIMASDYLNDEQKAMRCEMLGSTTTYFASILNPETHKQLMEEGKKKLSYKASVAALFINLYREEPILNLPFQLINMLIDIDNQMATWRFRHAQMVLGMIGNKIGTGGSSGHEYLSATTKKHMIYSDFHNISTLLIPRSEIPTLPKDIREELNFHFNVDDD